MNDDEWVTVARFPGPAEASMARTALENAGIEVFLVGETANTLIPIAFESLLNVRPADESAARDVLDSAVNTPPTEQTVIEAEIAAEGELGS